MLESHWTTRPCGQIRKLSCGSTKQSWLSLDLFPDISLLSLQMTWSLATRAPSLGRGLAPSRDAHWKDIDQDPSISSIDRFPALPLCNFSVFLLYLLNPVICSVISKCWQKGPFVYVCSLVAVGLWDNCLKLQTGYGFKPPNPQYKAVSIPEQDGYLLLKGKLNPLFQLGYQRINKNKIELRVLCVIYFKLVPLLFTSVIMSNVVYEWQRTLTLSLTLTSTFTTSLIARLGEQCNLSSELGLNFINWLTATGMNRILTDFSWITLLFSWRWQNSKGC